MERLQELYPVPGASAIIRELVRAHIAKIDAGLSTIKVEIPEELLR
jgi:hypothetical protein